jgi:hypothetical protein
VSPCRPTFMDIHEQCVHEALQRFTIRKYPNHRSLRRISWFNRSMEFEVLSLLRKGRSRNKICIASSEPSFKNSIPVMFIASFVIIFAFKEKSIDIEKLRLSYPLYDNVNDMASFSELPPLDFVYSELSDAVIVGEVIGEVSSYSFGLDNFENSEKDNVTLSGESKVTFLTVRVKSSS